MMPLPPSSRLAENLNLLTLWLYSSSLAQGDTFRLYWLRYLAVVFLALGNELSFDVDDVALQCLYTLPFSKLCFGVAFGLLAEESASFIPFDTLHLSMNFTCDLSVYSYAKSLFFYFEFSILKCGVRNSGLLFTLYGTKQTEP